MPHEFAVSQYVTFVFTGVAYDAQITGITTHPRYNEEAYVVHFVVWNHRFDETVLVSDASQVIFHGTPAEYVRKHPDITLDPAQLKKAMQGGPGSERVYVQTVEVGPKP